MDLDKIRNMDDESLSRFLKQLSAKNGKSCAKCGKPVSFIIKVENEATFQKKKLCGLCKDCYQGLLDYLQLYDIEWDT